MKAPISEIIQSFKNIDKRECKCNHPVALHINGVCFGASINGQCKCTNVVLKSNFLGRRKNEE